MRWMVMGIWSLAFALSAGLAQADTWSYPREIRRDVQTFGAVEVTRIYDGKTQPGKPIWAVEVRKGDELLARYRGVSYDKLFASANQQLFVGLSNSGLPGTAVMVFDAQGALLLEAKHDAALFDYCRESISLIKDWYDNKNPKVDFGPRAGAVGRTGLEQIQIRTCKQEMASLMELVAKAYAKRAELYAFERLSQIKDPQERAAKTEQFLRQHPATGFGRD